MTTTPAGPQPPTTPTLGEWQPLPARPGPTTADKPETAPLTRPQKWLIGVVAGAVLTIAALGFVGSYAAVAKLAVAKGFGAFAHVFPAAIDAGIIAFLALDLLLTWLRIPYPLLRQAAWLLTAATIAFNAATAWGDQLAVGMHAVIPVLFVIAVEAARHAIGRIADITADKHIESPPLSRWILAPIGTYRLWRRMRIWHIRSYEAVLEHRQQVRVYRARLRKDHGRGWRSKAPADKLLVLQLATREGMTIADAIALPEKETAAHRAAELERQEAARRAEVERLAAAEERRRREEAERLESARRQREEEEARELHLAEQRRRDDEEDRQRRIAEAETAAQLANIERAQRAAEDAAREESWRREQARKAAEADAERERQKEQEEHARRLAKATQDRIDALKREREEADKKRQNEAALRQLASQPLAAAAASLAATGNTLPAAGSRQTVGTPANPAAGGRTLPAAGIPQAASPAANANRAGSRSATASRESGSTGSQPASHQPAGTPGIDEVVAAYQQLRQRLNKAPSDRELGEELGVSRSRAQQLRTAAIEAGHTELAKPVRAA